MSLWRTSHSYWIYEWRLGIEDVVSRWWYGDSAVGELQG